MEINGFIYRRSQSAFVFSLILKWMHFYDEKLAIKYDNRGILRVPQMKQCEVLTINYHL